jgi:regulator of protease activity HflC (stomatin/prohibitin superfamily)
MLEAIAIVIGVLLVVAATLAAMSVRVLREYERAVVFRLGRLIDKRGPGLLLLIPSIDRMVRVSLRTVTLTVPPQEIITRDNVPARVTAVAYYRVVDPSRAVTEVENFDRATQQIAQTTLRSILGVVDLDTLLSEREHLNESLQQVIDNQTEPWGIKVTTVEIKDVEIPERMQHAIARQAEAERERRAKIINSEGEFQASARLRDAADVISENPTALQLRYLQTLREIGGTQNSTIVFPMPVDLVGSMVQALGPGTTPDSTARHASTAGDGGTEPAELDAPPRRELSGGNGLAEALEHARQRNPAERDPAEVSTADEGPAGMTAADEDPAGMSTAEKGLAGQGPTERERLLPDPDSSQAD